LKLLISSPVNLRHNLCIKEIVAIDRSLCFHDLLQYSTLEKIKNIVMKEQAERHTPRLMLTSSSLMEEQSMVVESEVGSICTGSFYTASGAGGTEENGSWSRGLSGISGTKGAK